jgi:hypothetical protein
VVRDQQKQPGAWGPYLCAVMTHELGHSGGLGHTATGVMSEAWDDAAIPWTASNGRSAERLPVRPVRTLETLPVDGIGHEDRGPGLHVRLRRVSSRAYRRQARALKLERSDTRAASSAMMLLRVAWVRWSLMRPSPLRRPT